MIQILKKFTFFCALVSLPALTVIGQDAPVKKYEENPLIKQISSKTADKVILKRELVTVDSVMMAMQLEEEDEDLPADDLYEVWNTERVNPYANVAVPDSFRVDISSFYMPFEGKITSNFGQRRRRFHYGTDIKVQVGDTIRAAFDGKVRVKHYERKGYGYYLVLRHSNGLETVYGHLSKFLVDCETTVKAGDPIALGGNTGRSTGSHLHFEMRFLGKALNPQEIVDFENFTTFDDCYVFHKSNSVVPSKYVAGKSSSKNKVGTSHRIRSGDTLAQIAKKYGLTVKQLCRLNNIKTTTTLRVGRTLRCS